MSTNFASASLIPLDGVVAIPDGVELGEFETSLSDNPLWVCVRGKHFQVRGTAREVILCVRQGSRTISEISAELAKNKDDSPSVEEVRETVQRLTSSAILQRDGEEILVEPRKSRWRLRSAGYFATYVPILSQEFLRPITTRLAVLFSPYWMARLIPLLLLVQIIFWWKSGPRLIGSIGSLNQSRFFLFLMFNYCGLFLHELGHAAACIRCGVKHGPIGFGIYLIFPAFYADVTDAWRLPNRQRMVVDAGGVYVTLALAWSALIVFLITGNSVAEILAAVYGMTAFFSLNPFLRMDGYWLVSDGLGIPNLMAMNREVTEWALNRLFRHRSRSPQVLALPRKQRRLYAVYYVFFLAFILYGTYKFYGWYVPRLVHAYPQLLETIRGMYRLYGWSHSTIAAVFRLVFSTVPALGILIYTWRFLQRTLGSAGRAAWKIVQRRLFPDVGYGT